MTGSGRRVTIATAISVAIAVTAPASALGGLLDDVRRDVDETVRHVNDSVRGLTGGGGGGGATTPQAGAPAPAADQPIQQAATEDPQPEGTNPHGQGSVLELSVPVIDQDVVVGKSRGEQDAEGNYHGKVTVVSALGLEAGVETDEGETAESPLGPVNTVLGDICSGSGNNVCLTVLDYRSETRNNGSFNSFSAATANVGNGLVSAELLSSSGNIGDDGDCQAATGNSTVSNVDALGVLGVNALDSGSAAVACRDGSQAAGGFSEVGGIEPVGRLADLIGCDNTAESPFVIGIDLLVDFITLAEGVCNGQTTSQIVPFDVHKALQLDVPLLDLVVLKGGGVNLLELMGAGSEALAAAPEGPDPECPDPGNPDCDEKSPDDDKKASDRSPGSPGVATVARAGQGPELPFTGADLGVLLSIAMIVMGSGLGLMAFADHRRRRATLER